VRSGTPGGGSGATPDAVHDARLREGLEGWCGLVLLRGREWRAWTRREDTNVVGLFEGQYFAKKVRRVGMKCADHQGPFRGVAVTRRSGAKACHGVKVILMRRITIGPLFARAGLIRGNIISWHYLRVVR
jgi:hypothetical protein